MYWITLLVSLPVMFMPCSDRLGNVISLLFSVPLTFGLWIPYPLGHCWFLSAQLLFYLCFNQLHAFMNRRPDAWSMRWLGRCWGCCGCCCCCVGAHGLPGEEGAPPYRQTPPRSVTALVRRLAAAAPAVYLIGVPGLGHVVSFLRLPQFYIGMLVGQACLHVEFDETTDRKLGRSVFRSPTPAPVLLTF